MYRLEGKDIVIDGFEQGIAPTPYEGIADMRNIEILSIPKEAMVNYKTEALTVPPTYDAVSFTATASTDVITVTTTAGLYVGCAIVLNTNTAGGLATGTVYYVSNITATTFKLRPDPAGIGTTVNITSDGSGTLTTYQYGRQRGVGSNAPKSYYVDEVGVVSSTPAVYLIDASNYAWAIFSDSLGSIPADSLVFLGNIGGVGATSDVSGVVVWKDYIILSDPGNSTFNIADLPSLVTSSGPATEWNYSWESITFNQSLNTRFLTAKEDDNVYFTTDAGLGVIIETPGDTFDPTDSNSYTITDEAILLPTGDKSTCLAELGPSLYIGATSSTVYVWDKVSTGFNQLLPLTDSYTTHIVATEADVYVFTGSRGRIFITNGSGVEEYKKFPDYLTGTTNPFYRWNDASYGRGQLYFSLSAYDANNTELTTVNGAWAIDLATEALRMVNKVSNSGYSGSATMVVQRPRSTPYTRIQSVGSGLLIGWNVSTTTYGVDGPSSEPYSSGESYIDTDVIPIGTYLAPFTPSQIEWKTSVPIGANGTSESVSVYYRKHLADTFTLIDTSTSSDGTVGGRVAISDLYKANFEKVQWAQFRVVLTSNSTTPTYNRLTELRIRDYPSNI